MSSPADSANGDNPSAGGKSVAGQRDWVEEQLRSGAEAKTTSGEAHQDTTVDSPPGLQSLAQRLDRLWRGGREPAASDRVLQDSSGLEKIGRFTLRREIGRGGFGVVYLADDPQLLRQVAVKVPRLEVLHESERLQRFAREAVAAASLSHRNITQVFEAELTAPIPYIVSAYCEGPDLGRWLAGQERPVPPTEAVGFVAKLAAALVYAHGCGVLHRDIKPGNVLLQPAAGTATSKQLSDFEPSLTDFGLAKLSTPEFLDTRSSLLIGTPLYMAPEQLNGGPSQATAASDIYSLGVLLFELLTLQLPLQGTSYAEVLDKVRHAEPTRLRQLAPGLPAELETICERCLAKDPCDRYASMQDLLEDLQRRQRGEPIRAQPTRWRHRLARWRRKPERLVAAGRFSFWFQFFIVVWCCLNAVSVWALEVHSPEVLRQSYVDIAFVSLTGHLPKMWLALKTISGKRWAFWLATLTSALMLTAFVYSMFFESNLFKENYPTVHSRIATYMALSMSGAIELGLFLLAIPALRRRSAST